LYAPRGPCIIRLCQGGNGTLVTEFDRASVRASVGVRSTPVEAGLHAEARLERSPLIGARVFDRREAELVWEAMAAVAARSPADAMILQGLITELKATSELLERQRPLRRPISLAGETRDASTLIDHLCRVDGLSGDLVLPLKAAQSRAYLLTKINLLRAFVRAASRLGDVADSARMAHDLREELAQSIYTLLAEELLLAVLRMPDVGRATKQRAADQLISIWDDAALEIDDFAPLLESAWYARNRINSAYGTLLGARETFRLVGENCRPEVLEFFGREGMSADEIAAFEEFLFNMTSEELGTLRREMQRQGVPAASPAWAAAVLGRQLEELEHAREIDPMALYRSYQRRQLAADFRVKANAPGPRRTAEAYLLCFLLDQGVGPAVREVEPARSSAVPVPVEPTRTGRTTREWAIEPAGDGDAAVVVRHADVSCPVRVARSCDRFPLTVALMPHAPENSAIEAAFEVRRGRRMDVQLTGRGLHVLGPAQARIFPQGDRCVFFLRPDELGAHTLTLEFAQGGTALGSVVIEIEVVEHDVPYDASRSSAPGHGAR
jgi:hypothetical protein